MIFTNHCKLYLMSEINKQNKCVLFERRDRRIDVRNQCAASSHPGRVTEGVYFTKIDVHITENTR